MRWFLAMTLLALTACATEPQRANIEEEYALPPSSSHFWNHVTEAGPRDWFHLLNAGESALEWRLTMIDSAHTAIDMETFLWKPDEGGKRLFAHILAAADRGVKVRFLLDDSFTPHEDLMLHGLDLHPNIELRIYNPYHYRPDSMAGRTLLNLGDFQRLNHRLHNKTLTVDGWATNIGGRNLADEYFGLHQEHNFRDMEVLAMGQSVSAVSRHFDAFWNSGWSFPISQVIEVPEGPGDLQDIRNWLGASSALQLASESELEERWRQVASTSEPGTARFISDQPAHSDPANNAEQPNQLAGYLRELLLSAKTDITIVTAYLVPTRELLDVIHTVEARGVSVTILTNSLRSNNHLTAHAAYAGYIRDLLEHGTDLYELRSDAVDRNLYMDGPVGEKQLGLHAKFLLVDQHLVFIGSSNLDPRSLKLNTEVGLTIESEAVNRSLRDAIAVDFEPRNAWSVQLTPEGKMIWVGESEMIDHAPAHSAFQQLEDWFLGLLPIDAQM